jgi:hypothetical protein
MRFSEFSTKPSKPLTPEKARIEALKHQKENAAKALKTERERQKIGKAQQQLTAVISDNR